VNSQILAPIVVLVGWTMIVWAWMYATRIPAMLRAKVDTRGLVGTTGRDLDGMLPPEVQWKAHNYNHLLDEPTAFYAIALVLALIGQGDGVNATIAWIYVGLRIAHSLVQVTVNRVPIRFILFALSSLCIIALVLHAAIALFAPNV